MVHIITRITADRVDGRSLCIRHSYKHGRCLTGEQCISASIVLQLPIRYMGAADLMITVNLKTNAEQSLELGVTLQSNISDIFFAGLDTI